MQTQLEALAGKEAMKKDEVTQFAQQLYENGVEDFGRSLARTTNLWNTERYTKEKPHPLESLIANPEATVPTKEVAAFLVSLEWIRMSDDQLDSMIQQHNEHARLACLRATFGVKDVKYGEHGDEQTFFRCRDKVARLEGLKTRKSEVSLGPKPDGGILRKSRSDVFSQSFIKATRGMDEATGRTMTHVARASSHTSMCNR